MCDYLTCVFLIILTSPGNAALCVQPPDETLDDTSPLVLPTIQQPAMHEQTPQISTLLQQHQHQHNQCPPHFVQIPDVEMVRISA